MLQKAVTTGHSSTQWRIGARQTYLDEMFIRHPELNNGGAILKSSTYFNYEGMQEHAQLSVQLAKVSYPDQQDHPLFEKTCLDDLHATSTEAVIIVERVQQNVYGPHPTQVQKQIADIASAQDIRMRTSGWLKRNANAYNLWDTWRSLRRRHRAARSAHIYATTAVIDDLNKASRSITNTQGTHDIQPYSKPDTDEPSAQKGSGLYREPIPPHNDKGDNAVNTKSRYYRTTEVGKVSKMMDILLGQKRSVTEYMIKATQKGKAGMTRLKEKSGKYKNSLTLLYRRKDGVHDGQHTKEQPKAFKELGQTARGNRVHLREDGVCEEPPDLTNVQARMIAWYKSIAHRHQSSPAPRGGLRVSHQLLKQFRCWH